jgi:hypothetical protein
MEREHLERPGPDAGDRAQPAPTGQRVAGEQVDAPAGDLGRHPPQRERARRRELHRGQPRWGDRGDRGGGGSVAQPGPRAAGAERDDHAALDRDRPLELDQLLADGVRERLPGQRRAPHAQLRERAHRLADQRVVAVPVVERPQVVVDTRREAQPPDAPARVGLTSRARAEDHAAGSRLDDRHVDRRSVPVQEPLQRGAAPAQQAVRGATAKVERPLRLDLDAQLVLHAALDTG